MGPRAGLDGRKISSHRDSIPDRPAHSQSLYRLSYSAHNMYILGRKVKAKFTLEQATKAQRGSRVIAILFL